MKILGVESSATSASVSVVENGKVIALESSNTGLTHSQTLMPMVESTLKKATATINDIDYIAVSNGSDMDFDYRNRTLYKEEDLYLHQLYFLGHYGHG